MASSDRRASLSPGEQQQRTKSQSSSRSHRTPPNIIVNDDNDDVQEGKISLPTSRQSIREAIQTKRSESSTSNRSNTITSPSSNAPRKQRQSLKSSPPPPKSASPQRRRSSKRKKSSVSMSENERKQIETNNSERQDLSTHGLSMIPIEIFEITTLRQLILSHNNLSDLPSSIGSLVNLEYLDVSNNPLVVKNGHDDYSCFPREFRFLRNLQTLIVAECAMKHIPCAVWNLTSLRRLDLSRNKVGYIVADIGNLTDIRYLRLSQMDLDALPPEIGFCDKLETIDLTGNPIDTLPETLCECRQFYMIQLIEEGKIRSEHIPQVIFELENLRSLDLTLTKINSFPTENLLYNLTELYLRNNSFYNIPESLCNLEQLKSLDLSNNYIQTIPQYINQMKQIEHINLSFNKLSSLSKMFAYLSTLKKLTICHNQIDLIDQEFAQNKSILILDLSNNRLKTFPNHLCKLEQLETLDLRYNKIQSLPSGIRHMIGLPSMNTFYDSFHRSGLHLLGNPLTDPPSYIWKSTNIQSLFDYIQIKEKNLANSYYHLKIIFIGPKNTGKTSLVRKLTDNRKMIVHKRQTIDQFVSMLQNKRKKDNDDEKSQQGISSSEATSSALTDQWIENRISTSGDYVYNRQLRTKRVFPPPIKTYRSMEISDNILHKSTIITQNNFCFTLFDLANEPNFQILYPLIYDTNALYLLPVNLTVLLNILQAAHSLENLDEDELPTVDFNELLTSDWLYSHIFRYVESISDQCEDTFIAIVGLIDQTQLSSNFLQQELLNEIHAKVDVYILDSNNQRRNINFYSEFFPGPIYLDNDQMSSYVLERLETIARQWNICHHKQKHSFIKQYFHFLRKDSLIIDYEICLKQFDEQTISFSENDDETTKQIKKELKQMSFDDHLDYLKLIGDILCFGPKSNLTILLRPYYFLNEILSNTLFRSHINQWLNYEDNMVFRFSGYYPSQDEFEIDRQRLLIRGEFTWKMLNVLFYEQNNANISLTETTILDYCRLMERLYLGFVNESNLTFREFTNIYFVCPWLMNENCSDIDQLKYFKSLEQQRQFEILRCERTRRIKQQQLWFSIEGEQETYQHTNESIIIPELPSINQIEIEQSQILNIDSLQQLKIRTDDSNSLPDGFYERLLINLHPLFNERLDYSNLTLGRTMEKYLIKIERSINSTEINLTISQDLFERFQTLLHTLFLFYPNTNLRIET